MVGFPAGLGFGSPVSRPGLGATQARPRVNVTSQVWQRPQQASVVTRRPRQPGLWATKENSRTAQPRNPWRVLVRARHMAAVPATRSRRKDRCILGNQSKYKRPLFSWLKKVTIRIKAPFVKHEYIRVYIIFAMSLKEKVCFKDLRVFKKQIITEKCKGTFHPASIISL